MNNKVTRTTPLICIIGASGAGKTSTRKASGLTECVSYTNRAMRDGESEGDPYHFISTEEFERKIASGDFAEWREVYGEYKGVTWEELNNKDTFVISPDGVECLRKLGVPVFVVYIEGPPFERHRDAEEYDFSKVSYDYSIRNFMSIRNRGWLLGELYDMLCSGDSERLGYP